MKVTLFLACLATLAAASPLKQKSKCKQAKRNVGFENLKSGISLNPLTGPGANYAGLGYAGWTTESTDLGLLNGLEPHQGKKDITYNILPPENAQATIQVTPNNDWDYMDLHSLYFGCSIDVVGIVRQPVDCDITISAVTEAGESVSTSAHFERNNQMKKVTFPKQFNKVKRIAFNTGNLEGVIASTAIDSLRYTLYSC